MAGNNPVQWPPARNRPLRAIFDSIIDEFGPPDVAFRAGTRSFKVHKKVLKKNSSVLKAKLSEVWQTSGDVLQLDEEYVQPEVVEERLTCLYFMYGGEMPKCSIKNAYSLCIAADYLLISELIESCCDRLCNNITPENFFDLFDLSKLLNLDDLRKACKDSIVDKPNDFLLSPQIVKFAAKDLEVFFKKLLKVLKDCRSLRGTILSSLIIWVEDLFDVRSRDLKNLLKFVPPQALSSDALFRFIEAEFYSQFDESFQKRYSIRPYLPEGSSSTDKLYCVTQKHICNFLFANRLDLSAEDKWLDIQPELSITIDPKYGSILFVSSGKKIYFIEDKLSSKQFPLSYRLIKAFCTETGTHKRISTKESDPLDVNEQPMLAGATLNDYIYITVRSKSLLRYCLEINQWETLQKMKTARSKHRLVELDGLLYAIGGDLEPDTNPKPERYDPRANQWKYITRTIYQHTFPAAVTHEGQIYVLSHAGFEVYSPEHDQWTQLPAPDAFIRPSLMSIAGRLWLMSDSAHCLKYRLVFEFDLVKQEWTRLPDPPEGNYTDYSFVIKQ